VYQLWKCIPTVANIEGIFESNQRSEVRVGRYASDYANHFDTIKSTVGKGRSTDCPRQKLYVPAKLHLCGHTQADRDVFHAVIDENFVAHLLASSSPNGHVHGHVHHALC